LVLRSQAASGARICGVLVISLRWRERYAALERSLGTALLYRASPSGEDLAVPNGATAGDAIYGRLAMSNETAEEAKAEAGKDAARQKEMTECW
jgi:hypothetical protein